MLKRSLVCLPVLCLLMTAYAGAQNPPSADPDLENQVQDLKKENKELRDKVDRLEESVDQVLKSTQNQGAYDRYYSMYDEDVASGFIKKGSQTGAMDKLLNVNLFMAVRWMGIENSDGAAGRSDADRFTIPFTRLYLSGQAFRSLYYKTSFEMSSFNGNWLYMYPGLTDSRIYDAAVIWRPSVEDVEYVEDFNVTTGLTQTFLSPAGQEEPWQIDFVEYAAIVYTMLPPGLARDIGIYTKADFLDQGRLKFWLGFWNGAHRMLYLDDGYDPIAAQSAWGDGQNNDNLTAQTRIQANILDEHDYYFMVSGSASFGNVTYAEITGPTLDEGGRKTDRIFNAATEFRLLERRLWAKGEFMHARTIDSNVIPMKGYYVALGANLGCCGEMLNNWEVLYRYDRVMMSEDLYNGSDLINNTVGVNYYFDPDHKHDAKLMLNYIWRRDDDTFDTGDAFLAQFVLGF